MGTTYDTKLWTEPAINWLDYFVQKENLTALLEAPLDDQNKEIFGQLALQFAEQAVLSEKETTAASAKKLDQEDISFSERKAAFLWLCSLTLLAKIEWDLEYMIEKFKDPITLRAIIDLVGRWSEEPEAQEASEGFTLEWARWMTTRFILSIHTYYRVPTPPAKQTVSNPLNQTDAALNKAKLHRDAVADIVGFVVPRVIELDTALKEKTTKPLRIPSFDCFHVPYTKLCTVALNEFINGPNVLAEERPRPDFKLSYTEIPVEHVVNKMRYDLVRISIATGDFSRAKNHLRQFSTTKASAFLTVGPLAVDIERINAFRVIFRFGPLEGSQERPSTSTEKTPEDELKSFLMPDQLPGVVLVSQVSSWEQESRYKKPQLLVAVLNAVKAALGETPTFYHLRNRLVVYGRDLQKAFAQVLVEFLRKVPREEAGRLWALTDYLSVHIPGFAETLTQFGIDNEPKLIAKRKFITQLKKTGSIDAPSLQFLTVLLRPGNCASWTILTSTNATEIRNALSSMPAPYPRPIEFKFPEILAEAVLRMESNRPINELHAILLAKLEQITLRKNDSEWNNRLNEYSQEFGVNADQVLQFRCLCETLRVKTEMWNRAICRPWSDVKEAELMRHLNTLKSVFADGAVMLTTNTTPFAIQAMAFMLNVGDWDFLLQQHHFELPRNNRQVTVFKTAKLLAMYGKLKRTQEPKQAMIQGFFTIVNPAFEPHSRRSQRNSDSISLRERKEVYLLMSLVREPILVSYLLAYLSCLFNSVLMGLNRPAAKLSFDEVDPLFKRDMERAQDIWRDGLEEALRTQLKNALLVQPANPHWLKTYGDYELTRNNAPVAIRRYLEALLARHPTLMPPFDMVIFDDQYWRRVRACLASQGLHNLAAIVSQMITTRQTDEYRLDAEAIRTNQCTLDAGDDYVTLIFDHELAEVFAQHYETTGQRMKQTHLLSEVSKQCVNVANSGEIHDRERDLRVQKLVRSLINLFFNLNF